MVVDTKRSGVVFATVPAGEVAFTLKLNEAVLLAVPLGPPGAAGTTVQV